MNEDWYRQPAAAIDVEQLERAAARQDLLTKPPGSLGALETCAIRLAALQGRERPSVERVAITIFAADHGVAEEGVSAFPQSVTGEMVRNFSAGGAAITVLARELGAAFRVVNVGTRDQLPPLPHVVDRRLAPGTTNFCLAPAMSEAMCARALAVGAETVDEAGGVDLWIGGEMGIANTTSAAALACALLDEPAESWVGRGTGIDEAGLARKAVVINRALALHRTALESPMAVLRHLGGLEIAALTGAYLRCAQRGLPALVDGFICTAAALVAVRINPTVRDWLMFSHCSAEQGHRRLIERLEARPLLDLDLRLGEGSGAAVAVPILRMACALHNDMASFESAGVSTRCDREPS